MIEQLCAIEIGGQLSIANVESIRNLEDHHFLPPEGVNVYDLLRHDTLVLSKDAAKAIEQRVLGKQGAAK